MPDSLYSSQVTKNWADFLAGADRCAHAVQIYADLDELADSVATYLARGFDAGEPAVVVATAEHAERFLDELGALGWDARRIEREACLRIEDAEATLAAIMQGGRALARGVRADRRRLARRCRRSARPDARFARSARWSICSASAASRKPQPSWKSFGTTSGAAAASRFCAATSWTSSTAPRRSGTLPDVCRAHSHVLPASDSARLARSVDLALEEVLGAAEAGKVYALVGEQIRRGRVPSPQLVLMWVSANMPGARGSHPGVGAQRYVDAFRPEALPSRGGGTRTPGLRFWRPPLYQLSYAPVRRGL